MTLAARSLPLGNPLPALERWLFAPRDTRVLAAFRIAYAALLFVNVIFWLPDLDLWFGEDGVLPYAASRSVVDPDTLTLFAFLPTTRFALWFSYLTFVSQIALLGVGYLTRLQAVCAYVWLVSFQHRHMMLFDAEDNVFRLLGFCLVFMPAGARWSVDALVRRRLHAEVPVRGAPAWGLRLAQVQITTVYVSTVWLKLLSQDWRGGDALYYVGRLDDLFGRFPLPAWLFENPAAYHAATWSVLALELFIPIGLWVPRLRKRTLALAVLLHLGLDYAMNLFLFEWIMLVGLLAFLEPAVTDAALNGAAPPRSPDPQDAAVPRSTAGVRDAVPGA